MVFDFDMYSSISSHSKFDIPRGVHLGPILLGRGGCRGSSIVPFERVTVISYRLSIMTIALSLTIWTQFAIECLRRSNKTHLFHKSFPP